MEVKRIKISWNTELPVFAMEPFLDAVGDEYGWIGGFDDLGNLRCVLPFTIVRKGIFRIVRFRIETIMLGDDITLEEEKTFLEDAIQYFRSIKVDMIMPATTNTIFRTFPKGADAAPYGSYVIDLSQPEETLWGNLSTSHRRKVRLAMKQSVQIKTGLQYIDVAHVLVRDTFKRSGLSFMDFKTFVRYTEGLGKNVRILVAEANGKLQGCLLLPFSGYAAYYVYGGSVAEPVLGATNLLHWEAITRFKAEGVRRYDFVGVRINPSQGSKQEGLFMFKKRFGGALKQGYIWKYPLSVFSYRIYNTAIRIARGGDIVDAERHKLTTVNQE